MERLRGIATDAPTRSSQRHGKSNVISQPKTFMILFPGRHCQLLDTTRT